MRFGKLLATSVLVLLALVTVSWTVPVHAQEEIPPPEAVESDAEAQPTEEIVEDELEAESTAGKPTSPPMSSGS